jgi:hypothetical protein
MVARPTATTDRAGLRMESLSALDPGTAAGDIRIMDAASKIAASMAEDMSADTIVGGSLGVVLKDAVQAKAFVADPAAANPAAEAVDTTVAAGHAVADAGNG